MSLFGRKKEGKVPLNNDTMLKCMCGMCPVQAQSTCSQPKIKKMMDMKSSMGMKGSETTSPGMSMGLTQERMGTMMPKPEELPGPYCSMGVAVCKDLDNNKACICSQCQVFKGYNLSAGRPVEHFCFNGKAV